MLIDTLLQDWSRLGRFGAEPEAPLALGLVDCRSRWLLLLRSALLRPRVMPDRDRLGRIAVLRASLRSLGGLLGCKRLAFCARAPQLLPFRFLYRSDHGGAAVWKRRHFALEVAQQRDDAAPLFH
jgi:hypothetical protein